MKGFTTVIAVLVVVVSLSMVGCSQPAAAPAATTAPASAAKAVEPTKAAPPAQAAAPTKAAAQPAAAPTAAPAKKVDFPAKGKTISIIVPTAAGGPMDNGTRAMAAELEKQLGWSINVVNKAGAGQQIGYTDLAQAKPDGYTIGLITIENAIGLELDPERKTIFNQKSFIPLVGSNQDNGSVGVKFDSPIKTLADMVESAKAKNGKFSVGTIGLMTSPHLAALALEKAAGVKFAIVNFDASSERETALIGGKTDAAVGTISAYYTLEQGGQVRQIAILGKSDEPERAPGVKTAEAQGYKVYSASTRGFYAPAGTPKEIVDAMVEPMMKVLKSPEYKATAAKVNQPPLLWGPAELEAFWTETAAMTKEMRIQAGAQ